MADNCPECGGRVTLDKTTGDLVCVDCGYVEESREATMEATFSDTVGSGARAGPPLTKRLHDGGLGTSPPRGKAGLLDTPSDRLLRRMLMELYWISSRFGLSDDVREIAAGICRAAVRRGVITRCTRTAAAAVIYLALRGSGASRTLNSVALVSNVPPKPLARYVRRISYELKLRPCGNAAERLVAFLAERLGLKHEVEVRALEILEELSSSGFSQGRRPQTLSAAAVYLASLERGRRIPLSRLSAELGVSEPALRALLKLYRSHSAGKTY